ncbi:C2 domain-containing protein [Zopfochytrium polystomum]|nr:C2 domain-containing protein [Zopfochytrium polystomum]
MGIVEVQVVSARNLNRKDTFTNNDAFVELWLDDKHYKQKTSVVQSATPTWNQTFTFNYDHHHKIHFHVLDKDLVGTDGIGFAEFDFGGLPVGVQDTRELTLKASFLDLTPNGYLTIRVTRR